MGLFDFITEPVSSIIGAGINAVGGIMGNNSAAKQAQLSRDQSIEIAQNAHRWEVNDLKKAGLNPILSAFGNGASAPAMATASQSNPFAGVGDTLNSGRKIDEVDKKIAESTVDLQQELAIKAQKEAGQAISQQHLNESNEQLVQANKTNAQLQSSNIIKQNEVLEAQRLQSMSSANLNSALAVKASAEAGVAAKESQLKDYDINAREYSKETERYTAPVEKVLDTVGKGVDIINPLKKGGRRR